MPKDYAKHKAPRGKRRSSASGWTWFIGIVVVVAIVAAVIYSHKHQWHKTREYLVKSQPAAPATETAEKPTAATTPRFEFYSMLSNNNDAPASAAAPAPSNNTLLPRPAKTETPKITGGYLIQIASFPQAKAADELKAKLILQGINAKTVKVSQNNSSWYRVMAGPYSTQSDAQNAKLIADQNGYQSIIRKQSNP